MIRKKMGRLGDWANGRGRLGEWETGGRREA
jgi:hypothetical protein